MHRTLVDFGPVGIQSYGVMLVIAFWVGIELSARIAGRRGLDATRILDLGLVVLVSSIVGSRLLFVVTHLADYRYDKLGVFRVWEGGLTLYGGLGAAMIFGIIYLKRKHMPVAQVTDVVAPQIALGMAIARIGCFLNGCCFGKESSLPWACTFPLTSQAGWMLAGKAVHPTQIYSSIADVLIFLFLWRMLHRRHRAGQVFYCLLILYGTWRFAIDYLRYYEPSMVVRILNISLTWNQIASLLMVAAGLVLLLRSVQGDEPHGQS